MMKINGMNRVLSQIRTCAGLMAHVDPEYPVPGDLVEGCGRLLMQQSE